MKCCTALLLLGMLAGLSASEPLLAPGGYSTAPEPTPAPGVEPITKSPAVVVPQQPMPVVQEVHKPLPPIPMQVTYPPQVIPLYPNVKVRTPNRKDPCSVTQIIQVPNPCAGRCDPVYVKICVPPCRCPYMTVGRFGRITYDFGKYRVQIASRNGLVIVDYDA